MDFLSRNNVSFAIRPRETMNVRIKGCTYSLAPLLRRHRRGAWIGRLEGMRHEMRFAARRLPGGDTLIIATDTCDAGPALRDCRRRWGIECMFADTKRRGLNPEDTHITEPVKPDTLMAIVALAMARAYRCATGARGRSVINRKTQARREKSWFRTGLDALRRWLLLDPSKAIRAWTQNAPMRQIKQ